MKLKEYATKIKNRLTGRNTKPQKEEKDDLSEQILERTQEMIKEDRQEAVRAAVVEEPEKITKPEEPEPKKEERNVNTDVLRLLAITNDMKIDPEWSKDELIKALSEKGKLTEDEVVELLGSLDVWAHRTSEALATTFRKIGETAVQAGEAIKRAFKKAGMTSFQSRKQLISNNRRKMKGMPMIRAKALEKARKNKRRKPKK